MTSLQELLHKQTEQAAELELFVTTVNAGKRGKGPKGNWTPERLAKLGEMQRAYSDLYQSIEAHPEAHTLQSNKGRVVGRT